MEVFHEYSSPENNQMLWKFSGSSYARDKTHEIYMYRTHTFRDFGILEHKYINTYLAV